MAFRGRYTRRVGRRLSWTGGQYLPGRAPTGNNMYPQEESQRLLLSSNNASKIHNGRIRSKGAAVGSDFWVLRHFYDEFNNLGGGMIHFTPNNNPSSIATPHYLANQYAAVASFNDTDYPIVTPTPLAQLQAMGTDAIAMLAPNKPQADLSTFVGELREGLPHAIGIRDSSKERIGRARNAGDEYLNVEFGWKPMLRDLRRFADSYNRSEELLRKFHDGAGRKLRKGHRWPIEQDIKIEDLGYRNPVPILATANYGNSGAGKLTKTTKTTTERWFVACFVYYVPDFSSGNGTDRARSDLNQLYGVNVTPNVAWNLTPWSWAADYVGNVGSIMANLSYFNDGLVMPYCYVMETKSVKVTYEMHGTGQMYKTYPGREPYFMQSFETVSKYRTAATPFGFGLNWSGFSQKQLGILAALGISKGT